MPELHLQRTDDTLTIKLGEHSASIPLADIVPNTSTWQHIYDDAAAYGRELFEKTFRNEQVYAVLAALSTNERLLLVADDPLVAAIPWEYLRDRDNKLLASRLNFVRSIPLSERRDRFMLAEPLEIIAIPVSPVDEPRTLNTEREWKNLVAAVSRSAKALTVRRVRPPTLTQMERELKNQGTTIVHFMGHSSSHDGKGLLAFEDTRGQSRLFDAADFADALDPHVFFVVLNSCLSAIVAPTDFGNIAQALVRRGVPYALGMQFVVPDDAALELSQALYDFLLQGRTAEEAVRRTRRALEQSKALSKTSWLAGILVLYTSLHKPVASIKLSAGRPIIQPDPQRLQESCDLAALSKTEHLVGRSNEMSEVLDALLDLHPPDFVVIHGLGGIGKTALARTIADRVSWHYGDRVLATSFETFTSINRGENQPMINELFEDRFYNQLAHFYGIDPAHYPTSADLQHAILQRRMQVRSLLVLDNIETLIDALRNSHPTAKSLAAFVSRLKEGDGAVLVTSRTTTPSDWGSCRIIRISGLADDSGGSLFLALLPADRRPAALPDMHKKLSRRVQGHPLSIRLLAGRFAETTVGLETFLKDIEAELHTAEQATPTSLEDAERQATLYSCMSYSVKRLTPEQREVLRTMSVFQVPFTPEFAREILQYEQQAANQLPVLVQLGLLSINFTTFRDGELAFLELHPILRWYIQHHLQALDTDLLERYGLIFLELTSKAFQVEGGEAQSASMRYLIRQSMPDCEAALDYIPLTVKGQMASFMAQSYSRQGLFKRASELYEKALEVFQETGDVGSVARTLSSMASVLRYLGRTQEALMLLERALRVQQELGAVNQAAVTKYELADLLKQLGRREEALKLYEQSLSAAQGFGDMRNVAMIQNSMADLLADMSRKPEALHLMEQALSTLQGLGDEHEVAVTLHTMANLLVDLGRTQEAQMHYEHAIHIMQELGNARGVASVQNALIRLLMSLDHRQEALELCQKALHTMQGLGDTRGVALVQYSMADLLALSGRRQEALKLYEQSISTMQQLGDIDGAANIQVAMANLLVDLSRHQEAQGLYEQALHTFQELGHELEVAKTLRFMADLLKELERPKEAYGLYEEAQRTFRNLGDESKVAVTQFAMAGLLVNLDRPQEALVLYKQALHIRQTLGDRSEVGSTQTAMANLLMNLDRPKKARLLFKQALRNLRSSGDAYGLAMTQANYCQLLFKQGKHRRALSMAWQAYTDLIQMNFTREAIRMQEILQFMKVSLEKPEQFDALWKKVITEPLPTWLQKLVATSSSASGLSPEQLLITVRNTINVMIGVDEGWAAWRQSVASTLRQAQRFKWTTTVEFLTAIIAILDNQPASLPEGHPYAGELAAIQTGISAGIPRNDFVSDESSSEVQEDHLPFDGELISRSIAALLGSPQEKLAHAQYLTAKTAETADEDLKALIKVIQLALFTTDLSQLGRNLKSVYRHAWEAIVVGVEVEGVDPAEFEAITSNTLAVFGPTSRQRNEWRNNLVELCNQATARGNRNMAALLNAVIGLLDAGRDATGLGQGLKGIYAKTWREIVEKLPD